MRVNLKELKLNHFLYNHEKQGALFFQEKVVTDPVFFPYHVLGLTVFQLCGSLLYVICLFSTTRTNNCSSWTPLSPI